MKRNKIILSSLLLAAAPEWHPATTRSKLTLDAPEVKLMESIVLEVSDVLPPAVGMDSTIVYTCSPEDAVDADGRVLVVGRKRGHSKPGRYNPCHQTRAKPPSRHRTLSASTSYETSASVQVHVIPELIPVESASKSQIPPRLPEDGKIFVTDELQFEATVYPARRRHLQAPRLEQRRRNA